MPDTKRSDSLSVRACPKRSDALSEKAKRCAVGWQLVIKIARREHPVNPNPDIGLHRPPDVEAQRMRDIRNRLLRLLLQHD